MATRFISHLPRALAWPSCPQCPQHLFRSIFVPYSSLYSTTPPQAPPLLLKLRTDLKTAMRAKDSTRLSVLRNLLSDITNASKTSSSPPSTDIHILSMLRKRAADGKKAAQSFADADRSDLADKEGAEVKVLEEYASGVEVVGDEDVRARVGEVVNGLMMGLEEGKKVKKGDVVKRLLGPGGVFEGKPVERSKVVEMVDVAMGTV